MATSPRPFIAAAPPAKIVYVSDTTLFHLALTYLGNALLWTAIASANSISDPWIVAQTAITIPNVTTAPASPSGLLGF